MTKKRSKTVSAGFENRMAGVSHLADAVEEIREVNDARQPTPKADEYHGKPALHEALAIVQHARDLEVSRGRIAALPEGAFMLQRLLVAVLESMTPEQRADVRRRLGE